MARISDHDRTKKQAQARELYIKDLSITFIAEAVQVKADTLKIWAKEGQWEDIKRANNITPSQIQNMILQCAETIKQGKVPAVSPDQLAKLASAFEKLSDKHKHLGYMIDAFTELRTHILQKAQAQDASKDKEKYLVMAQTLTPITDEIINTKFKEIQ